MSHNIISSICPVTLSVLTHFSPNFEKKTEKLHTMKNINKHNYHSIIAHNTLYQKVCLNDLLHPHIISMSSSCKLIVYGRTRTLNNAICLFSSGVRGVCLPTGTFNTTDQYHNQKNLLFNFFLRSLPYYFFPWL